MVKVDVTNTGSYDGYETVQLYVKDDVASVARPEKELKDFRKIWLNTGETKTVHFTLSKRDFAFWDVFMSAWKIEHGGFEILVGPSSDNIKVKTVITMW
jgi:beta-glucosidase